ncbi:hypothetical protein G6F68_010801 [Rhizopus microsporus]|nr:hypothetical protein G6F68_010801 [Rhizopus microsporus]
MLQRLTNHVYPSTIHRVVNPPGELARQPRYSVPFFLHPNPDFLIDVLPSCISPENPSRYPEAITAHGFLEERLREIKLKAAPCTRGSAGRWPATSTAKNEARRQPMVDAVVAVQWLEKLQNTLEPYPGAYLALMITALLVAAGLANWVTKRILLRGLRRLLSRLPGADTGRGSHLMRVISRLSNVVPSQVIASGIRIVPDLPPGLVSFIIGACQAWAILTVVLAISHALDAANDLYERRPEARNKPIKGYLQVAKIVIFVIAGLSIVATLAGVDLRYLVTGLGAATAVLMRIFQATILSLVASPERRR